MKKVLLRTISLISFAALLLSTMGIDAKPSGHHLPFFNETTVPKATSDATFRIKVQKPFVRKIENKQTVFTSGHHKVTYVYSGNNVVKTETVDGNASLTESNLIGVYTLTIPGNATNIMITAVGASGGKFNNTSGIYASGYVLGGLGASFKGSYGTNLQSQSLSIVVGQKGAEGNYDAGNNGSGGGGGSFVYKTGVSGNPLIAAGGGGGAGSLPVDFYVEELTEHNINASHGIDGNYGLQTEYSDGGTLGQNGNGGGNSPSYDGATPSWDFPAAGGGAGWLPTNTDNINFPGLSGAYHGSSPQDASGAFGGVPGNYGAGGYGGAGAANFSGGGGGGGYSGGGGGAWAAYLGTFDGTHGGGGGSFFDASAGTKLSSDTDFGTEDTDGTVVVEWDEPAACTTPTITGSTSVCVNSNITLNGSGTPASSNAWASSNPAVATVNNSGVVTGVAAGTATITYTNNGGCSQTATVTVTANVTPSFTQVGAICSGGTLSALPTTSTNGITGTWSPAINNTATTTYTFTPDAGQCATTATMTITVNPLPSVSVSPSSISINNGNNTTLTASGAATYTWSPATGLSATSGASVTANPITTTSYTVTGVDANGCSNTASSLVTVTQTPATALNFDGVNDIVTIPRTTGLDLAGNIFTIEYWAKPTAVDGGFHWVISKDENNADLAYLSGLSTNNKWRFIFRNFSFDLNGTSTAVAGTWYHVACTYDGATAKLYVNGVLEASQAITVGSASNNSNIALGARTAANPQAGQFFKGDLDEVRIWSRALCAEEINNNKNCELGGTQTGLQAYYQLNAGNINYNNAGITTATDNSGNNNNGTLSNFTLNGTSSNWSAGTVGGTCTVFDPGTAGITGANTICAGSTTQLSATPSGGTWVSSNTNVATVSGSGLVTSVAAGTATITYTSLCGAVATINITVNQIPTVNAVSNQEVCHNGTATAAISFSGSVPGTVYNWTNNTPSIGLAASGTGDIASFLAQNTGNTPVTATITVTPAYTNNGVTCTGSPVTFTITVDPIPVFNAIADQTVCTGTATTAVSFVSAVAGTTYNWFGGAAIGLANGSGSTLPSFTAVNASGSPVTVNMLVVSQYDGNNVSCGTSRSFAITVNPLTTPTFTQVAAICSGTGLSALPTTSDNGITGTWSPALNNTATTTYTFTPDAGQCAATATMAITVNPQPVITGTTSVCVGGTTTLGGSGTPATGNAWTSSDPAIATVNNAGVVTGIAAGNVTITYTNNSGCAQTATVQVNGVPTVLINTSGSTTICAGGSVILTANTEPGLTYEWSTGETTASITASAAGTYTLTAKNASGCAGTASVTVAVAATPNAPAGTAASACSPNGVTLTASADAGETVRWFDAATGGNQLAVGNTLNTNTSGTFYAEAVNGNGCVSAARTAVTATIYPAAAISGTPSAMCIGGTAQLSGTGVAASINAWVSSNPSVATVDNSGKVTAVAAGNATITYTTNGGCSANTNIFVSGNPGVGILANGSTTICAGSSVTLNSNSEPGLTLSWNPGSATTSSITVSAAGTYTLTGTNASGCSSAASVTVLVATLPAAPAGSNVAVCAPNGATLTATAGAGETVRWFDAATGGNQLAVGNTLNTNTSGTFYAEAVNGNGCASTTRTALSATINPLPVATITAENNIVSACPGQFVTLHANVAPGYTYQWKKNGNDLAGETDKDLHASASGNYTVVITSGTNCVSAPSNSITVTIEDVTAPVTPTLADINVECSATAPVATTTDACAGTITGTTSDPLTYNTQGDHIVHWTFTDPSGNSTIADQHVIIKDVTAPTVVCPGNITVTANTVVSGQSGAMVSFTATGSDNCGTPVITYSQNPGTFFPAGTTTVTVTADDGHGNTSTCHFDVIVNCELPVFLTHPSDISQSTDPGVCGAVVEYLSQASGDPSIAITYSFSGATTGSGSGTGTGSLFNTGTTNVVVTASNICGTVSSSFSITVNDTEKPVITGTPSTINKTNDAGTCGAVVTWAAATASDNCAVVSFTSDHHSGDVFAVGTTTVTYTATDAAGNTTTSHFDVVVSDNESPVVTCPSGVTVTANTTESSVNGTHITYGTATASDNCGVASITYSMPSGGFFPVGDNLVDVTVTDIHGNVTHCSFHVVVNCVTPVFTTCPSDISKSTDAGICGAVVNYVSTASGDPATTYSYSFSGATTGSGVGTGSGATFNTGVTTVTVTASNICGSATCSFTVTVNDTEKPVITAPADITVNNDPGKCSADISSSGTGQTSNASLVAYWKFDEGSGTTVADQSGNNLNGTFAGSLNWVNSAAFTAAGKALQFGSGYVVVQDNPAINTLQSNMTIEAWVYQADNANNTIIDRSNYNFLFEINPNGQPGLGFYNPNDGWSYSTTSIPVNQWVHVACTWNSNTHELKFYKNGVQTDNIHRSSALYFNPGVINIGRQSPQTCACNIMTGMIDELKLWSGVRTSDELLASASNPPVSSVTLGNAVTADNCGVASVTNDAPGVYPVGTTNVTWTVTDIHGNTETAVQKITVLDKELPKFSCPGNINVYANITNGNGDAGYNATYAVTDATDNCGVQSTVFSIPSGSFFGLGTTPVTVTVTDIHGNVSTCTFTVTVNCVSPVFTTCGTDQSIPTDAGNCSAVVNYTVAANGLPAAGLAYTFSGATTGSGAGTGTGSVFNKGVTTVTVTASNICGSATCSFTVTVNDTEKPVITGTPSTINKTNDAGNCGAAVTWTAPTATDNCAVVSFTSDHHSGDVFAVGTTTVTYTVTDAAGNTTTTHFDITVTDNENPVITVPADVTHTADPGLCSFTFGSGNQTMAAPGGNGSVNNYDGLAFVYATATDNCGVTVAGVRDDGQPLEAAYPVGVTTITWTATDIHGHTVSGTQKITVTDDENPVIVGLPNNITKSNDAGQCGAVVNWTAATATDNCPGVTIVSDHQSGEVFPIGSTIVTYTATDAHGHSVTGSFTVIVNDTQKPTVTAPGTYGVPSEPGKCGATIASIGQPQVSDNCGIASITNDHPSAFYPVGTTTVIWIVTDIHGNVTDTAKQLITVIDNEKPTITAPASVTVNNDPGYCGAVVSIGVAAANDNCGVFSVTNDHPSNYYPVGTTIVTWTVLDIHGYKTKATQLITVIDNESPVITVPSDITHTADAGLCSFTFDAGSAIQTAPGGNGAGIGHSGVSLGVATAIDNCAVTVTGVRDDGQPLEAAYPVGVTTITWTATDPHGNTVNGTQKVTITDDENPVIVGLPGNITKGNDLNTCGAVVNWTAATATDNCPGVTIVSDHHSGDVFPLGTTLVTYTATDAHGHSVAGNFSVTVSDIQKPVVQCPADITVNASTSNNGQPGANVTFAATASDNCGVPVISYSVPSGSFFPVGTTTVTTTVDDGHGNTATCTFNVTVNCVPPVITVSSVPTSNTFTGGVPTSLYLGYGAQSTVLQTAVAGSGTYSYAWNGSGASMLNSTSASAPKFTPAEAGSYQFNVVATNSFGCQSSASISICVTDIRVPGNMSSDDDDQVDDHASCDHHTHSAKNCPHKYEKDNKCDHKSHNDKDCPYKKKDGKYGDKDDHGKYDDKKYQDNGKNYGYKSSTKEHDDKKDGKDDHHVNCDHKAHSAWNCPHKDEKDNKCDHKSHSEKDCPYKDKDDHHVNCDHKAHSAWNCPHKDEKDNKCDHKSHSEKDCPYKDKDDHDEHHDGDGEHGQDNYKVFICHVPPGNPSQHLTLSISINAVAAHLANHPGDRLGSCEQAPCTGYYDWEKPVITCPPAITVDCSSSMVPSVTGKAKATDNSGVVAVTYTDSDNQGTDATAADYYNYTITRTWKATDPSGNSSECSQLITVRDQVKPIITCPGNTTLTCTGDITPATSGTATATDNSNGPVTITYSDRNSGDGIYRTWTATDASGNYATCTQKITVRDDVKPVITAPADMTVQCGTSTSPSATGAATGTDNCSAVSITYSDYTRYNVITRTWKATDASGNYSTDVQKITIVDNVKPVITAPADKSISCGASTEPKYCGGYATGTDGCSDVNISYSDATAGNVIVRTWKATDASGNYSTAVQNITIIDNVKPVITDPRDYTISCGASTEPKYCGGSATATDNCSTPVITYSDVINDNVITRTWKATDAAGNYSTSVQKITIVDNTKPVITDVKDVTISCAGSVDPSITGMATATDNCSDVTITYSDNVSGNYITRTWKATDAAGNYSTSTQKIIINDNVKPVITSPADKVVGCGGSTDPVATGYATATDNCSNPVVTYTDQLAANGVITRTWKATDAAGNYSTSVQMITKPTGNPCALPYPYVDINNPRTSITFNEGEVLRAIEPGINFVCGTTPSQIKVWYNDEHALTLGVRQVIVKTKTGTTTTNYPVSAYSGVASTVVNPALGTMFDNNSDQSGNDIADAGGRPLRPVLYVSDITNDPNNRAGDWQHNGTPFSPDKVSGSWKAAVRTVDKTKYPAVITVTPDADPKTRNNWSMGSGGDVVPAGLENEGYGAEIVWNIASLNLLPGHTYRIQVIVHDGDQNKAGGDAGQACTVISIPTNTVVTSVESKKVTATTEASAQVQTEEDLKVTVMPNPSTTYFTLKMESKHKEVINLRVFDANGRVVDAKPKIAPNSTIQIGQGYSSGTYYAEMIQGTRRKVVQLIKGRG